MDKFETEFYPDGSVRDWKSTLTVIEEEKPSLTESARSEPGSTRNSRTMPFCDLPQCLRSLLRLRLSSGLAGFFVDLLNAHHAS